jgi:penicillin G amidase
MKLSRVVQGVGLAAGAAIGLGGAGLLVALRRSLPQTTGVLTLSGLQGRVEVLRDRWGVPHIYAHNTHDLFLALGYVHAQDRLWQMEVNRRTGHGQLAELIGPAALDTDRFLRVLGFGRVARQEVALLAPATRAIIEAYVAGINTFLAHQRGRLPLEFTLLRHRPRPWDVADVIVWSKILALNLTPNWATRLLHQCMATMVGEDGLAQMQDHYLPTHPVTVGARLPLVGTAGGQGSNGWVVSGSRSASGNPLLANDPHLIVSLPSMWYEVHLEGGDIAMAGVTFPGMPPVIIGHNADIAWGITNAMTDVQDLYLERFDPANRLRYQWLDGWREAQVVREEIRVRGRRRPVVEEVRITHHGPVVSPILAPDDSPLVPALPPNEAIALRWTALEPGRVTQAALDINRARNWGEFREALRNWNTPAINFVYADQAGHIGYMLAGHMPIRAAGDAGVPVPGWSGEYEWRGAIPHDELPSLYDPPEGMVATANNRITDDSYPYPLSGDWFSGYRIARIRQLLVAAPRHNVQTFGSMQQDVVSLPGLELARLMADVPLEGALEQQARDMLLAWDGSLTPERTAASVYAVLRSLLEQSAYARLERLRGAQAGIGFFSILPYNSFLERRTLPLILARIAAAPGPERSDPWLDDGRTWNGILQTSMTRTVAYLCEQLGDNPAQWRYGQIHRLALRHPLGMLPGLSVLFNRGKFPIGGDVDTICMGYMPVRATTAPMVFAPSYRMICDTGNWNASCSIMPGGQSGHPASPHYSDMVSSWRTGGYHPMVWSRPQVEHHTVARLRLEPAP